MTDGNASDPHLARLARKLPCEEVVEQVRLRRDAATPQDCDEALEVLSLFGACRAAADVASLVTVLAERDQDKDVVVVLEGVALRRPVGESAGILPELAEEHAVRVVHLLAHHRTPADIARFLCAPGAWPFVPRTIEHLVASRSTGVVARVELGLRGLGQQELAVDVVRAALKQSSVDVGALMDFQIAFGAARPEEETVVVTHMRDEMSVRDLAVFVRREYRQQPARAMTWAANAVASGKRTIGDVIELTTLLLPNEPKLVERGIVPSVARTRPATELVTYAIRCGSVFEHLFREMSLCRDGDTVGDVLLMCSAQHSAYMREKLIDWIAGYAPVKTLLSADRFLDQRGSYKLADKLLRRALYWPENRSGREIARLLASIHANVRRWWLPTRIDEAHDVVRTLNRLLEEHADEPAMWITKFAELACGAVDYLDQAQADKICTDIGDAIFNRHNKELRDTYLAALRGLDKTEVAEKFERRM